MRPPPGTARCSLDLHPRVFTEGRCAQTMLARAQAVLLSVTPVTSERDGGAYWVIVRASFAEYLAAWLLDAATEYVVKNDLS